MGFKKYIFIKESPTTYKFRCGLVDFHRQLIDSPCCGVDGGGFFEINEEDHEILLLGESGDFGRPKDIEASILYCKDEIKERVNDYYLNRYYKKIENIMDYKIAYIDENGVKKTTV